MMKEDTLADDLLKGAAEIAEFVYGDRNKRRRVYHDADNGRLPIWRNGGLVARRSRILEHIKQQEDAALRAEPSGEAA